MARYKSISSYLIALRKTIGKTISKNLMKQLGEVAIEKIVKRTRKGYGVPKTNASREKLKPLSVKYIERRKRSKLDKTTSARKSNLTFTGQMLRSMRVKEATNRRVRWGPNKRRRKGGLTNEELGEIVSEQRPFNHLSKQDISSIAKNIDKNLARKLKKL